MLLVPLHETCVGREAFNTGLEEGIKKRLTGDAAASISEAIEAGKMIERRELVRMWLAKKMSRRKISTLLGVPLEEVDRLAYARRTRIAEDRAD